MTADDWIFGLFFVVGVAASLGEFLVVIGRVEDPWWRWFWDTDDFSLNLAQFLLVAVLTLVFGAVFVSRLVG